MKKVIKNLLKLAVVVGIFTGGYLTNELTKGKSPKLETTVHAEQKETQQAQSHNLSAIPTNQDNIFSQYFTIEKVDTEGVTAKNTYFSEDEIFIDQEYIASLKLEAGTKVIVTWNHDDIINVSYDLRNITTYNIIDSKEYGIDTDTNKYVFGVNPYDSSDFVTIDKKDYKIGDIVEVTFQDDKQQEIQSDKKVGQWKQDDPKIVEKVVSKPIFIEKGYKQPENNKKETISSNEVKNTEIAQNVNTKSSNENNNDVSANKPESQNSTPNDTKQDYKFEEKSDSYINSVRQYIITENTTDKLIHAVNVSNDQEKVLLENDNYKEGDTIEVTYGTSGYHDDIVKCVKLNK
ncbi:hypothetical protein AB1283_00690 [Bacillus sp. S13(2024)]|uniref:hypothetical protein n=1 Tax=Bacillus sp. S13(2024) TaxID=3162885 RepID=UPI003D25CC69